MSTRDCSAASQAAPTCTPPGSIDGLLAISQELFTACVSSRSVLRTPSGSSVGVASKPPRPAILVRRCIARARCARACTSEGENDGRLPRAPPRRPPPPAPGLNVHVQAVRPISPRGCRTKRSLCRSVLWSGRRPHSVAAGARSTNARMRVCSRATLATQLLAARC